MAFVKQTFKSRKSCIFCSKEAPVIKYSNLGVLKRAISENGKLIPSRMTGTCRKHQTAIAKAVKQARILALLPFIEE